jgi:hypothetical protein
VIGYWDEHFWKVSGSFAQLSDYHFTNIGNDPVKVTPEVQARVRGGFVA